MSLYNKVSKNPSLIDQDGTAKYVFLPCIQAIMAHYSSCLSIGPLKDIRVFWRFLFCDSMDLDGTGKGKEEVSAAN
jgi:hypothetical protein